MFIFSFFNRYLFGLTPQILHYFIQPDRYTCTCSRSQVWRVVTSIKLTDVNFLPGLEKPCKESWSLNTFKFSSLVKHDRLSMLQNANENNYGFTKKKPDLNTWSFGRFCWLSQWELWYNNLTKLCKS